MKFNLYMDHFKDGETYRPIVARDDDEAVIKANAIIQEIENTGDVCYRVTLEDENNNDIMI